MNDPTHEASTGWSPMMIGALVLGGILLLLLIPTFRAPSTTSTSPEGEQTEADAVSRSQCERSLLSAIDGLQPTRLGISSESRVMVDTLNNWLTQCVDPSAPIAGEGDELLRKMLLTAEGFDDTQLPRFQLRDAEHIRNSLLASAVVDRITADLRTDHERALALFYYVVRTVDLIPDDGPDLLLTPYESLMFGMGSAADRGWTYALLMRQLRLDVVMIQPRVEGDAPYWLLGALVPGEGVLLLDPRLGLPITTHADAQHPQTPLPARGATLAQVREDDTLLRQFDQPQNQYPLSSGDFEAVDVFGIGTSSTFAPRLGRLQAEMPQAVELYDALASNELREDGLIDRLVAVGSDGLWTAEQVHVWPYPQRHWTDVSERTDEERNWMAGMNAVLAGPYAISITLSVNEKDELQIGSVVKKQPRSLRRARIEQLLGNFTTAQPAYLQARVNQLNLREVQEYLRSVQQALAEEVDNPQEAQQTFQAIQNGVMQEVNRIAQSLPETQLNALAAEMATFWAAQSQYELQDYRVAAQSALAYLQRASGNSLLPAVYLASLSLVQDGRPAEAVELYDQRPDQTAISPGYESLIERWRILSGPQTKPQEPASPEKSKAEPTSEPESPADEPKSKDASKPSPADHPDTIDSDDAAKPNDQAPTTEPAADSTEAPPEASPETDDASDQP